MRQSGVGTRLREALGGGDARRLARSGMVDVEYYAAQAGRDFSDATAAARHYLEQGSAQGFSLHPLFEPEHLRAQRPQAGEPVLWYLSDPQAAGLRPHPLFDVKAARRVVGAAAAKQPGGAWLAWLRDAAADTVVPMPKGSPELAWGRVRERLLAAALEWRKGTSAPVEARRVATSLVLPVGDDLAAALRWRHFLDRGDGLELVHVAPRTRAAYSCLTLAGLGRPVTVLNAAGATYAEAVNAAAEVANGERVVVVAPGTELDRDAVAALAARLDDPAIAVVQPLAETFEMNVHSAGAYYPPDASVPVPLLTGHAAADAERMGSREIPALWSPVFAVRSADFAALGGLDPAFDALAEVDLSLRARESGLGVGFVDTEVRATVLRESRAPSAEDGARLARRHPIPPAGSAECLAAAGFVEAVDGLQPTRSTAGAAPVLRWAIDIAATPGRWGAGWGDRHFAVSLARSLRTLGQQVAIDHRGAGARATRVFDDVVLTIRGLYPVRPTPGAINLLWVISHPDDVTADELRGYDRVFAASPLWAARRGGEWGVPIEPLLQCTDAELFRPGRAEPDSGPTVLFVGNAREPGRPVVEYALAAGADLALYGTGWERTPAAGQVAAATVPNEDLGALYAGAGVVLNDHWADMRELGFVSNRLFDAVACGARVLSDRVDGVGDLFGDCVQTFAGPTDVARLLASPQQHWPGLKERIEAADRVRAEHSFDARAAQLLAAALSVRAGG